MGVAQRANLSLIEHPCIRKYTRPGASASFRGLSPPAWQIENINKTGAYNKNGTKVPYMALFLLLLHIKDNQKSKRRPKNFFCATVQQGAYPCPQRQKTPSHLFIPFPLHYPAHSMFPVSEKNGEHGPTLFVRPYNHDIKH